MIKLPEYPLAQSLGSILEAARERAGQQMKADSLRLAFSCIDLTSLNTTDGPTHIRRMVQKVNSFATDFPTMPHVAAICVYPNFASTVKETLNNENIGIAVVTGVFPSSQSFIDVKTYESRRAVEAGASELDMVISVGAMLEGYEQQVFDEIKAIKEAAGHAHLKVILESGSLPAEAIWRASMLALEAGADFIKTSTGKTEPAATPEAAVIMCHAIKHHYQTTGRMAGFKPAGGIRTSADAMLYMAIVEQVLGSDWMTPEWFRLGASSLANELLNDIARIENRPDGIRYF